jgi:hypothetical protein
MLETAALGKTKRGLLARGRAAVQRKLCYGTGFPANGGLERLPG